MHGLHAPHLVEVGGKKNLGQNLDLPEMVVRIVLELVVVHDLVVHQDNVQVHLDQVLPGVIGAAQARQAIGAEISQVELQTSFVKTHRAGMIL